MAKLKSIRPETEAFIYLYSKLKGVAFKTNAELAMALGIISTNTITEIKNKRQNIDPDKFVLFTDLYKTQIQELKITENTKNGLNDIGHKNFTDEIFNVKRNKIIANIDRMALASPIDINQDESPYTESTRKIPSSKAEQQDLCTRLEIMLDSQQNQIIEMLTATKRIKDYLDLLKMSMLN